MIVLMAGLPGTGKSTVARKLAARTGGRVLSKDEFRHCIFLPDEIEYSTRQDDFCQQLMIETAEFLLSRNPGLTVFLDGRTFSRRYQIENALAAAERMRQPWRILECICTEDAVRRRLMADAASGAHPAGNRGYELYREVKARFESISFAKTVIDTDQASDLCVAHGLAALEA